MELAPLVGAGLEEQNVQVFLDDIQIASWKMSKRERRAVLISRESLASKHRFDLSFVVPRMTTPKELGINDDYRQLALSFFSLVMTVNEAEGGGG